MLNNNRQGYGLISIVFHWISALAVIGLFALGWWMVDLTYYSEWYRTAPHYHKSAGLILAAVTLARLLWKWRQPRPEGLGKPFEKKAAHVAHSVLYVLLFSLFVSGYLISTADGRGIEVFNWFTVPSSGEWVENQEDVAGSIHEWLAYGLIGLVVLHALAAMKHHVIDKDVTLKRMLTPGKE